jgi:hypothetical protein
MSRPAPDPDSLDDHDRHLVSRDVDAREPWLDPDEPVALGHVLYAAGHLGRDPGEIGSRLAELGYRVPPADLLAAATADDLPLLGVGNHGRPPWLGPGDAALLRAHVVWTADRLRQPPARIAARLAELGHSGPAPDSFPERLTSEDLYLVRADDQLLPDDVPVGVHHLLTAADVWGEPEEAERELAAVVAVRTRMTELGYRIDPVIMGITAADLTLLGEDPGYSGRLHPDFPVPLHYVLRVARKLERDPHEVVARLREFGHRSLPEGELPRSVTQEDVELLKRRWNSWLAQDDPGWFPHVVMAAARTGKAPAHIARRLRALGFTVPETALPERITSQDVDLIDGEPVRGESESWLPRTEPVPAGHVLYRAHEQKRSAAAVAARLRELGYTRVPDVPDRSITADDLRLVSPHGDGAAPVLTGTVPWGRVVRAAAGSGASPREVADRYRELGYTDVVVPDGPLPASVPGQDALLATTDTGWLPPAAAVPVPHVVRRAHEQGIAPAEAARRLRALGYPDVPSGLPETAHPGDRAMIHEEARSDRPYLPFTGVTARHIQTVADVLASSPHEVAMRMTALGYALEFTPHSDDAVIASRDADGRAPWVGRGWGLGHVLLVAEVLGRTPREVADRCRELGYDTFLYGEFALPDAGGFEDDDVLLLSAHCDGRGPWLTWEQSPSLAHVLRCARATGRSPQEVAERLARLGRHAGVSPHVETADLDLAEALDRWGGQHWGTGELLAVASRTGRSPAEVAARLPFLGFPVPDLDYPDRRPGPR